MRYYYRNGDIPILILSLHGGKNKLKCSPRKKHKNISNFVSGNDLYTAKIAKNIFTLMKKRNLKPYLLVNNIHRKFIDLNRSINNGCQNNCMECKSHYYIFHNKLIETITKIKNIHGKCLIFDVHGNSHSKNMVQLGYHIKLNDLKNNNLTNHSFQSLRNVKSNKLTRYFLKNKSLAHYLQSITKLHDIKIFPHSDVLKNTKFDGIKSKYYAGTKTIMMNYKDICDVILLELSIEARLNNWISEKLTEGLSNYYDKVYTKI
tara:strand:- start:421 stop:1203 length:783 start_codon:yes stop_codon:yes gene_type:complete